MRPVNLIINKGECFGLAGLRGSGKTTLLQMLYGNLPISEGDFFYNGLNSVGNQAKVKKKLYM